MIVRFFRDIFVFVCLVSFLLGRLAEKGLFRLGLLRP